MTDFTILITGSRTWKDTRTFRATLDTLQDELVAAGVTTLTIRHGACYPSVDRFTGLIPPISADWLAHRWIEALPHPDGLTIREEAMPADWEARCTPRCRPPRRDRNGFRPTTHRVVRRGREICPAAGVYRNEAMVNADPRPDRGLAFILNASPGATNCHDLMTAAGIEVTPIIQWSPGREPSHARSRR